MYLRCCSGMCKWEGYSFCDGILLYLYVIYNDGVIWINLYIVWKLTIISVFIGSKLFINSNKLYFNHSSYLFFIGFYSSSIFSLYPFLHKIETFIPINLINCTIPSANILTLDSFRFAAFPSFESSTTYFFSRNFMVKVYSFYSMPMFMLNSRSKKKLGG